MSVKNFNLEMKKSSKIPNYYVLRFFIELLARLKILVKLEMVS